LNVLNCLISANRVETFASYLIDVFRVSSSNKTEASGQNRDFGANHDLLPSTSSNLKAQQELLRVNLRTMNRMRDIRESMERLKQEKANRLSLNLSVENELPFKTR